MLLALSVISHQSQHLGAASYRVFDARGGSIGRIEGNDWVLPDPDKLVSSRHANIRFVRDAFYLEDVSTNGTGYNAPQSVVPRGQLQPLNDGDHLFVGDFEILVQLVAEAPAAAPLAVDISATAQLAALRPPSGGALEDLLSEPSRPAVPPIMPISPTPAPVPVAPAYAPAAPAQVPEMRTPPAPAMVAPTATGAPAPMPAPTPPGALPDNWDLTGFNLAPAAAAPMPATAAPMPLMAVPTPMVPSAPASAAIPPGYAAVPGPTPDVAQLFASLGLQAQQVPPETLAQLGQILRVVVQGLTEVLLARKQVKDNFRMAMTIIRPVENNPLKFAATPEDALYTLFVKRNPGYLGPVEAFKEAFDDLSFHQLATLAGMRAAFFATLQRFDPDALEAHWAKAAGKKAGLFGGGKAALWEQFCQHYSRVTHDSEANFQQIFGEAFVRAYDDQIRKLQDARARHP
ncbi:MAG TPA: type VI secretion system-associated FHA domain protein TagH [Steroidobacteraceae bacterium]|nr:type VI secretion system-associated FHA domain protein TagH [Steroidobacteraceae bacterium]